MQLSVAERVIMCDHVIMSLSVYVVCVYACVAHSSELLHILTSLVLVSFLCSYL